MSDTSQNVAQNANATPEVAAKPPQMAAPKKRNQAPDTVAKPQNATYACKVPAAVAANANAASISSATSSATTDTVTSVSAAPAQHVQNPVIRITKNGPYEVDASIPLYEDAIVFDKDRNCMVYKRVRTIDTSAEVSDGHYYLCRCGHSEHKPFCDGHHVKVHFDGTEIASRMPYTARADLYQGSMNDLLDDGRCAFARFCHRAGSEVWSLTEAATDAAGETLAAEAAWECPTGRLTAYDRASGKVFEESWEPSITILEDPAEHAAGPLFVRGGVTLIGADGHAYESRNRYALCRCGASENKPFCDAMHINIGFSDDSPVWNGSEGELDQTLNQTPEV